MAMLTATAKFAPPSLQQQQQQSAAARITKFEAAIEADPLDITAWDGRLGEAVREEGGPVPVFERVIAQFPTAARFWASYAEWCEGQDTAQAIAVYQRCLQQLPSLDLWSSYLAVCKRHQPLEEIFRAFQRAVDLLGTDWRAGLLWAEYIALLKRAYNALQKKQNPDAEVSGKLLAEDANPIETARRAMKPALKKKAEQEKVFDISDDEFSRVAEALSLDLNAIRAAFQRAVTSAHSAIDKLWVGYEQFEKSLGNPQLAQKLLGEYMPKSVRCKAVFKELQTICSGIEHFAIAVPITQKNSKTQAKLLEKWRKVLNYERTNPLRQSRADLQARVSLVYQQAALSCAYHADIWYDFSSWLDLFDHQEKATVCLRQAVERFLPQDLTLRLLIAHRHEMVEVPPSQASLQAADDAYQALLEDMPKPCPLALISYLAFVRRQRGGHDFRDEFLEATVSSPHCTWEVYAFAALTEYHVFGSTEAAVRVFRLGLERYREHEPSLLAAYVNFLVGANDLRGVRTELSRGVLERLQAGVRDTMANRTDTLVRDSLAFLWQKWARIERYFGDAGAVRRAVAFRDEEYRNLQRDQDVEEEAIVETPVELGLSTTIEELEESFRFQHLVPQSSRASSRSSDVPLLLAAAAQQTTVSATMAGAATLPTSAATQQSVPPVLPAVASGAPVPSLANAAPLMQPPLPLALRDQEVADALDEHRRLASNVPAGYSVHIARPDVTKMLAFRPALDVVGRKCTGEASSDRRRGGGASALGALGGSLGISEVEEPASLPTMIPKCLQDLLAVLPSRPLKGAKPDVDYLLTVLQTVSIPPIPVKDLSHFRYDSLRIAKDEDSGPYRRGRNAKDELEGGDGSSFFSFRPSIYRDRLQAKRQKVMAEHTQTKDELAL